MGSLTWEASWPMAIAGMAESSAIETVVKARRGYISDFSRWPIDVPANRRAINRNCAMEKSSRWARASANCAEHVVSASPRHFRLFARRPVSGLTSLDVSPSQALAQWPIDTTSLAYRCGGSTGMVSCGHAPVSRLTAAEPLDNSALRHLARLFFRSLPAAKLWIIAQ